MSGVGAARRIGTGDRGAAWLAAAIIGVGTLIRIPQLFHDLVEAYSFRQTQTAFTVREYAEHGIDLLASPLPVFGPEANVPMEFPLFQAIASLLARLGLGADLASRLLGLVSFQIAAVLLLLLLRRWFDRTIGVVALVLFEFLPFALLWGASSLIDFMSVALALAMVLFLDKWFAADRGRWWWLAAGAASAALCALVKITTFPGWYLLLLAAAIVPLIREGWRAAWLRLLLGLVGAPAVGLAAGIAWTRYADAVKGAHEITAFLTSSALNAWNFGTLDQRLDPGNYAVIGRRIMYEIAGPALIGLVLAVLAAILLRGAAARVRTWGWIAAALAPPLVFFNLYVVHDYYLIGVFAAIVGASAIGLVWLWRRWAGWRRLPDWLRSPVVAIVALLGLGAFTALNPLGLDEVKQFLRGGEVPQQVVAIDELTRPDDLVVTIGCDWDPTWLYTADRRGVMFREADAGTFWEDHSVGDYAVLFTCNQALDPSEYLPAGARLEATPYPYLLRIVE